PSFSTPYTLFAVLLHTEHSERRLSASRLCALPSTGTTTVASRQPHDWQTGLRVKCSLCKSWCHSPSQNGDRPRRLGASPHFGIGPELKLGGRHGHGLTRGLLRPNMLEHV